MSLTELKYMLRRSKNLSRIFPKSDWGTEYGRCLPGGPATVWHTQYNRRSRDGHQGPYSGENRCSRRSCRSWGDTTDRDRSRRGICTLGIQLRSSSRPWRWHTRRTPRDPAVEQNVQDHHHHHHHHHHHYLIITIIRRSRHGWNTSFLSTRTRSQDNKAWKTYSEKEDCAGWVTFCGWTTDGYHNRHYTKRFQVSREDQVDQGLTGWAQSRKICERWRLPGKKQKWQLLTDKNGVRVWPNASTWMRVESRSRSRPTWQFSGL